MTFQLYTQKFLPVRQVKILNLRNILRGTDGIGAAVLQVNIINPKIHPAQKFDDLLISLIVILPWKLYLRLRSQGDHKSRDNLPPQNPGGPDLHHFSKGIVIMYAFSLPVLLYIRNRTIAAEI